MTSPYTYYYPNAYYNFITSPTDGDSRQPINKNHPNHSHGNTQRHKANADPRPWIGIIFKHGYKITTGHSGPLDTTGPLPPKPRSDT